MDNEIAHMGVVDGLLRLGLPGDVGGGVVRIDADDIDLVQIFKFCGIDAAEFAAEDEMKQLLGWSFGHWLIPAVPARCAMRRAWVIPARWSERAQDRPARHAARVPLQ